VLKLPKVIDFLTMSASEAEKKSGELVLYLHLICMTLSWGCLLPWGVALANRTRNISGQPKGAWFKLHRNMQIVGWVVQLIGFVMAVWHVKENAGGKSETGHAYIGLVVVAIGTMQPFNAAMRPHPPDAGEARSAGRLLFEIAHKGGGYVAIVLGLLNVCAGVKLLGDKNYNTTTIVFALTLCLLGAVPVIGYVIAAIVLPNNKFSRMCVGAGASVGIKVPNNPDSAIGKVIDKSTDA